LPPTKTSCNTGAGDSHNKIIISKHKPKTIGAMVNIITQTQDIQDEPATTEQIETVEDNRLFKSTINRRGQVAPRKLVQLTMKGARVKEGDVIKVRSHSRTKTVPTMKAARAKQDDVIKVRSHSRKKMVPPVKSKGEKQKMSRGCMKDPLYKASMVLLNQIRFNDLMDYHQRVSRK
jgi:hypothetical protein